MTANFFYRRIAALLLAGCLPVTAPARAAFPQAAGSLTLEAATEQFLRRNLAVEAARLEVGVAEAERVAARLRPRPGLTLSSENLPVAGETPFNRLQETGLTYTQSFELGGQRRLRLEVAEKSVAVAEAQLASVLNQRLFELKRAYYEAVLARVILQIEQENRQTFDELVRLTTERFREGDVAGSELMKVKLERIKYDATVAAASLALRQAKIRLLEMIGESEFSRAEAVDVPGVLDFREVALDLSELRRRAATGRAEVKVAESNLARAESAARLERARGKGEVTPYVGYKRVGIDNTVLAGVTVPLPFGNRNQGGVARAEAEQRIAETDVQMVRNRALADVESAYRAYETAREQARLFEAGVLKQADESLDITTYAYREGAVDLIALLEARRTRASVRVSYYRALLDYYTSLFRLELATGAEIKR